MSSNINTNENSNQLKEKLLNKLKDFKTKLNELKSNISDNLSKQETKINKSKENFIKFYEKDYNNLIKDKKEKTNKNVHCYEYWKIINNIKELKTFTNNLTDIVINSIENYNNFLSNKLPYYKRTARNFLLNESQRLYYNNIFAKLSKSQIDLIYNKIKDKQILSFINCNYQIKFTIDNKNCDISNRTTVDTISQDDLDKLEIKLLNEEELKYFFNEECFHENENSKVNELSLNNCDLRKSDFSLIPYNLKHLKIIQSKISYNIFEKCQFNVLISLNLDNNNLDSENFENIFQILFKKDNICNNLKLLSAKNNYISRIIQDKDIENIKHKLTSLEIFNLSNNNISNVNIKIFDLIPNLKIMDLSKNSLNRENICQDIINKCHGMVILINNIGIMGRKMNQFYVKYYIDKLNSNEYPVDSINTESLVYKRNCDNILNINFLAIKNKYNIREINLSSCFINDNNMIQILNNCIKFNNSITKLNLSHNILTHVFFELSLKNSLGIILDKLDELDLSFNAIKLIKANKAKENLFVNFTNSFNHLHLFNIKETPLEATFNNYIKIKVNKYHAEKMNKSITISKDELSLLIEEIIDKKYLHINDNFRFVMNATIHDKYLKQLDVILPFFEKHFNITRIPKPK